jgi:Uma2 family endonuclease
MATKTTLTLEQYMALPEEPDGTTYELSEGELVKWPPPKFPHGLIIVNLVRALGVLSREEYLVSAGDVGCILDPNPEAAIIRAADIAVIRRATLPDGWIQGGPVIAVEVVSPSNSASDLQLKVKQYLEAGSLEVWLVYPEIRTVYVYSAGQRNPNVYEEPDEFQSVAGATFRVADFFET